MYLYFYGQKNGTAEKSSIISCSVCSQARTCEINYSPPQSRSSVHLCLLPLVTISPCTTFVQYCGGEQYRGVFSTAGGYHEYHRGC